MSALTDEDLVSTSCLFLNKWKAKERMFFNNEEKNRWRKQANPSFQVQKVQKETPLVFD